MTRKRRASSTRWLNEHESDPYVREARARGYRSRARFKLEEIDQRDGLARRGMTVVELGAAPGGWCEYLRPRLGPSGRVIAVDLLPMDPIPGVEFLQGDFREATVLDEVERRVAAAGVDLVLSDMAPNISGVAVTDQAATMGLTELAAAFARDHLKPGGALLVKVFEGDGLQEFVRELRASFAKVAVRKPAASRARSRELYVLARNYRVV
ncbi:MAG TPA: 23S rRNA (uridine(2552)-2'-O)-methyltransferase RlmE [Nevskiaceae bacterium]